MSIKIFINRFVNPRAFMKMCMKICEIHTADLNENINENFVLSSGLEFVTSTCQTFLEKSEKGLTYKTTSATTACTSISPLAFIIDK